MAFTVSCDTIDVTIRYGSYLVLFCMLFYANYLAPDAKHNVDCGCAEQEKQQDGKGKDGGGGKAAARGGGGGGKKKKTVMICGVQSSPDAPFGDGAFAGGHKKNA